MAIKLEFLQKSPRLVTVESRTLPRPLSDRDDFKRLPLTRKLQLASSLKSMEEVPVAIDGWFLSVGEEPEATSEYGVLFSSLEAKIEVMLSGNFIRAEGDNFSWWIFRDSWYPDILSHKSMVTILPNSLRRALSEQLPQVGDDLPQYLGWLEQQKNFLFDSFDQLYAATDYSVVYVQTCAIFAYLSAIYLVLQRARLTGYYMTPIASVGSGSSQ